jgi:predicted nucleotidyltransferase
MRFCGVISEYNPFHNGHAAHMQRSREMTGADYIVCVMSGHFVQRGEAAIFDKWTRAACALMGGADAVIELPLLYAVQSAEGFARGGVAVLDALGADAISFGSETDNIDALTKAAKTFSHESHQFKETLRQHLDAGYSYPKARMMAAFEDAPDELQMPNAILGIEYIRALLSLQSAMTPYAVRRIGSGYHDTDACASFASATAIRRAIYKGQTDTALAAVPDACADYLRQRMDAGLRPVFGDAFDEPLLFTLRRGGPEYIHTLHDVSEGIENRIYDAALKCTTRNELIDRVKTKRYTYTRISRILLYALLGITRDMVTRRNRRSIDHIRVLGARNTDVLSALSASSRVPLVTGAVASSPVETIDISASDVYALTQTAAPYNNAARDYTEKLILCNTK